MSAINGYYNRPVLFGFQEVKAQGLRSQEEVQGLVRQIADKYLQGDVSSYSWRAWEGEATLSRAEDSSGAYILFYEATPKPYTEYRIPPAGKIQVKSTLPGSEYRDLERLNILYGILRTAIPDKSD